MNIFRGTLMCTNDRNVAIQRSLKGWKVLYIGDPKGEERLIESYGFTLAAQLLPEYSTLVKDIDGYTQEFDLEYVDMLGQEPAVTIFAIILSGLVNGDNIVLFFPVDINTFRYPSALVQYILQQYGIVMETESNPFMYDDKYNNTNLMLMYSHNILDHRIFVTCYTGPYDNNLIDSLIYQIRPALNNPNDYNEKYNAIMLKKNDYIEIYNKGGEPIDVCHHVYD